MPPHTLKAPPNNTSQHYDTVTAMYENIDSNGDGLLDREEFLTHMVPLLIPNCPGHELSKEKRLINRTLRQLVQNKVTNLQKQHATLTRIFRRSAHKDGYCSDMHLSNLLKICHRRAPRPAPVVTPQSVKSLLKEFYQNDDTFNPRISEKKFVGQSLVLINKPDSVLDNIATANNSKLMAVQMLRLIMSECNNIQKEARNSNNGGEGASMISRQIRKTTKKRIEELHSSSDEDSEIVEEPVSSRKSSLNFGWERI